MQSQKPRGDLATLDGAGGGGALMAMMAMGLPQRFDQSPPSGNLLSRLALL